MSQQNYPNFYIKTNRVFNNFKKYSWTLIPVIAFGGLYYPKLGLLLIPIMITLVTLGFFKGKYWCGNLCPHGSLFDSFVIHLSLNRTIPGIIKSRVIKSGFFLFYMTMFTLRLIKVSQLWGSMVFVDRLGFIFAVNYLIPTTIGTVLALFVSTRAWCSFCPMGTMEQLAYKLGKLTGLNKFTDEKVTVTAAEFCHKCGKCSRVCPMQLKPYHNFTENNQFEDENCIRCTTCVENCPAGILTMAKAYEAEEIRAGAVLTGYKSRTAITAVIEEVRELPGDVRDITFKFLQPERLQYKAGQFILVKILDDPEMFRAYSISSANIEETRIRITVKKLENGLGTDIIFTRFKEGDQIELEGPLGRELVVSKKADKVLLVAGGIGITPFLPIVGDLLENRKSLQEVKLIYGVNKEEEFIYEDYFRELAAKYEKFTFIQTVANPGESWKGYKGFVTDAMNDLDLSGFTVYMCGPKPMTVSTVKTLGQKGVDEDRIFAESA